MSPTEESLLLDAWEAGDLTARDTIARSLYRIVQGCVTSYARRSGLNASDLESAGAVALALAMRDFDRSRGCRISTYARVRIVNAVAKEVRSQRLCSGRELLADCADLVADGTPEYDIDKARVRRVLSRAIRSLPAQMRTVVVRTQTQGATLEDVGSELGVSREWARILLRDALAKVRALVGVTHAQGK